MPAEQSKQATFEREVDATSGWPMLFIGLALLIGGVAFLIFGPGIPPVRVLATIVFEVFVIVMLAGLFSLQPNEARVLILFGSYMGTVRKSGFHWANPFYSHNRGKVPWAVGAASDGAKGPKVGLSS